jgi:hypothetical protein
VKQVYGVPTSVHTVLSNACALVKELLISEDKIFLISYTVNTHTKRKLNLYIYICICVFTLTV